MASLSSSDAIQQRLQEARRNVAISALYGALQRLQNKEAIFVSPRSEPTGKRGGRSKIYYELTRAGQGALTAAEEVRFRLRSLTTHTVLLRSQL